LHAPFENKDVYNKTAKQVNHSYPGNSENQTR
jgi:hypothetical protein